MLSTVQWLVIYEKSTPIMEREHCGFGEEYITVLFRHAINLKYKFKAIKFLNEIDFLHFNGMIIMGDYSLVPITFICLKKKVVTSILRFESCCVYALGTSNKSRADGPEALKIYFS